jgi:hypothetical protein
VVGGESDWLGVSGGFRVFRVFPPPSCRLAAYLEVCTKVPNTIEGRAERVTRAS